MNTDGTGFSLLHGGDGSKGTLTLIGSKIYGLSAGDGNGGQGTLFSMNLDGTGYGLLHSFTGGASDGANPRGSLTLSGTTFYGTTSAGGTSNRGTIFSINTDGTGFGLLDSFAGAPADGNAPYGDLTLSGDASTLYGMTLIGGTTGGGTVFSKSLVPEPSTALLLVAGAGLLLRRRRG